MAEIAIAQDLTRAAQALRALVQVMRERTPAGGADNDTGELEGPANRLAAAAVGGSADPAMEKHGVHEHYTMMLGQLGLRDG